MNLCTSVFVYVVSIGLYKRIVNADTQNIRIANAEGQRGGLNPSYYNKPYYARKTPPSSKTVVFDWPRKARHSFDNIETMLRSL